MQTGHTIQKHDLVQREDGEPFGFGTVGGRFNMDFESVPRLCERFGLTFPELGT